MLWKFEALVEYIEKGKVDALDCDGSVYLVFDHILRHCK